MARATRPAMPDDDFESGAGAGAGPLTRELAHFCESGITIVAATCGPDGWPLAVHASGCRVDGPTVRILVERARCSVALESLVAGAGIAATFSRPFDHRSIQFKAARATVVAADDSDVAILDRQLVAYRGALADIGYPPSFVGPFTAYEPADLAAIAFVPEEAFVQTPGPGAGSAIR